MCDQFAYIVISCAVCQTESSSPSEFLELDLNIQGKSNLQECIQDFLQVMGSIEFVFVRLSLNTMFSGRETRRRRSILL